MLIHRYWQGPPPQTDYTEALKRVHPWLEVRDWTPEELPAWVRELTAATAPLVTADRQPQHTANVARVALLWEHGGWWADHDLEVRSSFTQLPMPATAAHSDGSRCNCWLAFPLHHPVLDAVLTAIAETPAGPPGRAVNVSGEKVWDRVTPPEVPGLVPQGWARHHRWTARLGDPPT